MSGMVRSERVCEDIVEILDIIKTKPPCVKAAIILCNLERKF